MYGFLSLTKCATDALCSILIDRTVRETFLDDERRTRPAMLTISLARRYASLLVFGRIFFTYLVVRKHVERIISVEVGIFEAELPTRRAGISWRKEDTKSSTRFV
jgi:hypothetical protein